AKLAEYHDTRTDLPIRKFVLIANLLKKVSRQEHPPVQTEEAWFDMCLEQSLQPDQIDSQEQ
ncbi:hypothetical protein DM01DRAFT_1257781, partial [Hesseltinella vesiculosa]